MLIATSRIRVSFTIADLHTLDDADQYAQDQALGDEEEEGGPASMQQGGAQPKGATSQGRTRGGNVNVVPEGPAAPASREELADDESPEDESEPSFPARVNVTVEKAGNMGAIQIESVAQDGMIVLENVYFVPRKELADPNSAELDWTRRTMYTGPPFGNLDEDLQVILERYLEERGVNTALALWVPEYIDFKEQREYINWLNGKRYTIHTACLVLTNHRNEELCPGVSLELSPVSDFESKDVKCIIFYNDVYIYCCLDLYNKQAPLIQSLSPL